MILMYRSKPYNFSFRSQDAYISLVESDLLHDCRA
jgi:hypothetical protein